MAVNRQPIKRRQPGPMSIEWLSAKRMIRTMRLNFRMKRAERRAREFAREKAEADAHLASRAVRRLWWGRLRDRIAARRSRNVVTVNVA